MKKERGITLIALIITIIIMLILAGVVINLTIGKNGIFKIAKQAAKNYTNAEAKELADLNNITNIVEQAVNDEIGGNVGTKPNTPETPTIDESILALKVGDYIKYNSGANGEILCRVLYPTSSEYGLQIISDYNVNDVTLGGNTYSEAVESYNNAIETLNNEAEAYINTEYAYDVRCVGSIPTVENGMFTKKDNGATSYVTFTNTNYIDSLMSDTNYETDDAQLKTGVDDVESGDDFWYASRYDYPIPQPLGLFLFVHSRDVDSVFAASKWLCRISEDGAVASLEQVRGLRPCISLKSNIIKITGGDGKSADTAYVIGK